MNLLLGSVGIFVAFTLVFIGAYCVITGASVSALGYFSLAVAHGIYAIPAALKLIKE